MRLLRIMQWTALEWNGAMEYWNDLKIRRAHGSFAMPVVKSDASKFSNSVLKNYSVLHF